MYLESRFLTKRANDLPHFILKGISLPLTHVIRTQNIGRYISQIRPVINLQATITLRNLIIGEESF